MKVIFDLYWRIEYDGRDFYFCSDKCMGKFCVNLVVFVGVLLKFEVSSMLADGVVYICFMYL